MTATSPILNAGLNPNTGLSTLPREISVVPKPDGEGNLSLALSIHERNGDRVFRHLYGIEAQQLWAALDQAACVAKNAKRRSSG